MCTDSRLMSGHFPEPVGCSSEKVHSNHLAPEGALDAPYRVGRVVTFPREARSVTTRVESCAATSSR
jgi:hypothetical protein